MSEGPEGLSEGPKGLHDGVRGLLGGWGGQMDGCMEFLPILQDFVPNWVRCPKRGVAWVSNPRVTLNLGLEGRIY